MLLAIDIGNTNIAFGIFKADKLAKKFVIPTKDYSFSQLKRTLGNKKIDDIIISSVVPQATWRMDKDLTQLAGRKIYILGKNIKVPVKNLYRHPAQVGQDRLVNAYAGIMLYGAPLIIVDFGTAITFDVISRRKEYLGGLILPGLKISLEALTDKTALLPKISLGNPKELIGRDTKNSMLSGMVYGFSSLTDNLIEKIKAKIGANTKVVATGGDIKLIARYCRKIDTLDADLTLKGLNIIYRRFT